MVDLAMMSAEPGPIGRHLVRCCGCLDRAFVGEGPRMLTARVSACLSKLLTKTGTPQDLFVVVHPPNFYIRAMPVTCLLHLHGLGLFSDLGQSAQVRHSLFGLSEPPHQIPPKW